MTNLNSEFIKVGFKSKKTKTLFFSIIKKSKNVDYEEIFEMMVEHDKFAKSFWNGKLVEKMFIKQKEKCLKRFYQKENL